MLNEAFSSFPYEVEKFVLQNSKAIGFLNFQNRLSGSGDSIIGFLANIEAFIPYVGKYDDVFVMRKELAG